MADKSWRRWRKDDHLLWFVVGENGSLWLSTASFSRKDAIAKWESEVRGTTWRHWYRKGFRCHQVKISYQVQR